MKARSPAWIVAGAVVLAQASGVIGTVGKAITGIDDAVTGVIDLKRVFHRVVIEPIQPIVVPSTTKTAKMPVKAPVKQ